MQREPKYDSMMRLLVVGNSSVGKTCLLRRFSQNEFQENFNPTVGIDFVVKNIKIDKEIIKVQIFDTAGQERFKSIISSYFRTADGILMIFDVTDKQTLDDIDDYWLRDINLNAKQNVKLILVGNKSDLNDKRKVSQKEAIEYAKSLNIVYIETSAKTSENVKEAFEAIVKDVYIRQKMQEPQYGGSQKNQFQQESPQKENLNHLQYGNQSQQKKKKEDGCC